MASGDKFYIAEKATLDEVKGKIGNTADTGGSSTAGSVFGKLNYLVSQVSSYLSNIYNNCLKIGATTDSGGTSSSGSLMAKTNALLTGKGVSGKILSDGKIYMPILQEQLILVDKSPIISDGGNYTGVYSMALGKSYIYFFQAYGSSSTYCKLMSMELGNKKLSTIYSGITFRNSIKLKNCINDNYLYFIGGSAGSFTMYRVNLIDNSLSTCFPIGANVIQSMFVTNSEIYLYNENTRKIEVYSTTTNSKIKESPVLNNGGQGPITVNGNYVLHFNFSDSKLYLMHTQYMSLLTTLQTAGYTRDIVNYGSNFMCTSSNAGETKILEINGPAPASSILSAFNQLGHCGIDGFDYFSDGSIMFTTSDNTQYGSLHMILSPNGEVTRLSDNHDYLNTQLVGQAVIDINTDHIYRFVASWWSINTGPGDKVSYIGKFIKSHSIVGYRLED